jgi:hypothetical protein
MTKSFCNVALVAATIIGGLAAFSIPARAHHGWDWAQAEQTELKGTIQKISMAPPHPSLQVKASDGKVWTIELANPAGTERSGFNANAAKAGDPIVVLGNRDKNPKTARMKAVRITVGEKQFDLYPERIRASR